MKRIKSFCPAIIAAALAIAGCYTTSGQNGGHALLKGGVADSLAVKGSAPRLYGKKDVTEVKAPDDYRLKPAEKVSFSDTNIRVFLYAGEFALGNAGYYEIVPDYINACTLKKITFNGAGIPFTETAWGWRGFFAINPESKPGSKVFTIEYRVNGSDKKISGDIMIRDVKFPVSKTLLDLGRFSDKEYTSRPEFKKLIEECAEARRKAFSTVSEDKILNRLSHPRDMHRVTGPFWKKRIYAAYKRKGKKKVKVPGHYSFHRGLDLKGDTGAPVFSMADGRVVLAMKMFYEGNLVAVDHGNRIFSYYMHMESMKVKEGERVKAGDIIGTVGSTGTSTASHLHVALSIRGVHVHPLSLLSLPVSR